MNILQSVGLHRAFVGAVAGAVALVQLMPATAQAQSSCKWYGTTALKQQQQNERLKCGFNGPQWHSNLADHIAWCSSVPPDVWKKSARERDGMLANCAKGN